MSEETPHPPHEPHSSNMVRNIVTGIITTVVGATFVYFLNNSGKHNNNNSSGNYLEIKQATRDAWKSYVKIEDVEYQNSLLLEKHMKDMGSLDELKDEITKESNKFTADIEALSKKPDIDDALLSLLKRRMDDEKEAMDKWNDFFTSCKNIFNTTQPGQERAGKVNAEYKKMQTAGDLIVERFKIEITNLSKSLTEKYGEPFAVTDLQFFQNEKTNNITTENKNENGTVTDVNNKNTGNGGTNSPVDQDANKNVTNTNEGTTNNSNTISRKTFVGEWNYQVGAIRFNNDGRMYMQGNNGQTASGTWHYANNQISITYPNEYGVSMTYTYNLFYVKANSFTMQLSTNPNFVYNLTRYTDNY